MLGASHLTDVRGKTLRQVLREDVDLGLAPDGLFELFSYITGGAAREKARALAKGEDPDGDAGHLDVLAVLHKFPSARPHAGGLRRCPAAAAAAALLHLVLAERQSRRPLAHGRRGALPGQQAQAHGVASTFLADAVEPGDSLKVYVQKAHAFALPEDNRSPSSWWARAPGWRRSGPSCRSGRRRARRARTGCSSATRSRPPTSSTATSSRPCARMGS